MSQDRVAVFIPPLRILLAASEQKAGRPLSQADVESIANHAVCMMMPRAEAERLIASHGFEDLDPSNVWDEWRAIRPVSDASTQPSLTSPRGFSALSIDPNLRHQELINLFGRHLFVLRNRTVQRLSRTVEAPQEERDKIGKLHRVEYDAVAALDREARQVSINFARKAIDSFLKEILALFTNNGAAIEMAIDDDHSVAYELILKILSRESLDPVEEHRVNRNGEKVLFDYFGRWLNNYSNCIDLNP